MHELTSYQQTLVEAGFSKNQAVVYTYLIEHGTKPASIIARRSRIPRTLTYKVLAELEDLRLVLSNERNGSITTFTPAHPIRLTEMIKKKRREIEVKSDSVANILNDLTSSYNKTMGQPGVVSYEGIDGVKAIYNDVIHNNKSNLVQIIRSHIDSSTLGNDFFSEHSTIRARKGIHTKIITPRRLDSDFPKVDKGGLKERKSIPDLKIPAEIDIYDDKVAIIAFEEPLIGTIIEKPAVAETMRTIFSYLWDLPDKEEPDET